MTVKRYDFQSCEDYEEQLPFNYDEVCAVTENGWFKADVMCSCKRWKTAVRRFFKACPELKHWEEEVIESVELGFSHSNDARLCDGTHNPCYSFSWGVEQHDDDLWYIYLNEKVDRW